MRAERFDVHRLRLAARRHDSECRHPRRFIGLSGAQRGLWELQAFRVFDGGADGDADTTADNTVFLRPGVFIP